ncbi:MAG: protein-glutamate O-methyltransferase CheR [Candidatus Riflebacteria bacterium]|nr:protein-glutamate O-methyltransferase CheR [Candidatus Riflebacteria bacterium]
MSKERLPPPMEITDQEFELFRRLLEDEIGIVLKHSEKTLVANRLRERVRELHLSSYFEYYRRITEGATRVSDLSDLADALTTRKTDFFRHLSQMESFRTEMVPRLVAKLRSGESSSINIWSAGCSTGEEPYTLAVLLQETVPFPLWPAFSILATDVSPAAIRTATEASYPRRKLGDVSSDILTRYFEPAAGDGTVKVRQAVRRMIMFREHNLKSGIWAFGQFDVTFCRNVLIYFSKMFQEELIARFYAHLKPGGYLYIGHSETLQNFANPFQFVEPMVYRRPG